MSGPPEAQLIHTLSKFHCLIHELCPTNHHSSLEHAIDRTSYNWCSFKSKINKLISLSPGTFFHYRGIAQVTIAFPRHNSLKKIAGVDTVLNRYFTSHIHSSLLPKSEGKSYDTLRSYAYHAVSCFFQKS